MIPQELHDDLAAVLQSDLTKVANVRRARAFVVLVLVHCRESGLAPASAGLEDLVPRYLAAPSFGLLREIRVALTARLIELQDPLATVCQ